MEDILVLPLFRVFRFLVVIDYWQSIGSRLILFQNNLNPASFLFSSIFAAAGVSLLCEP
jgi:hypothetical protein